MPQRGPHTKQEDTNGYVQACHREQVHGFHHNPSSWLGLVSRTELVWTLPLQS